MQLLSSSSTHLHYHLGELELKLNKITFKIKHVFHYDINYFTILTKIKYLNILNIFFNIFYNFL